LVTQYGDYLETEQASSSVAPTVETSNSAVSSPTPEKEDDANLIFWPPTPTKEVSPLPPVTETPATVQKIIFTTTSTSGTTPEETIIPGPTIPLFLESSDDDEYQPYTGDKKYVEIDSADETIKLLTSKDKQNCKYK
jgi:hypothetical protein